jgi:endonuclease/exonuclease/phosphatase family metal-dependent hydrolase
MTYNILNGAEAGRGDPDVETRLPRVLEVIREVNPDILGIQEANRWHANGEAIAREVAKDLGMNYALGLSCDDDFHVALFSKFEIQKVYPSCFLGTTSHAHGALHAELVTSSGRVLHVYVVHLTHEHEEVTTLIEEMAPYLEQDTILMGDMNFLPYSAYATKLTNAGWVFPMVMDWNIIDHVWTSPSLAPSTWPELTLPSELTYGASDHNPFIVRIGLYPPETK